MRPTATLAATLLVLAACGEPPRSNAAADRSAHNAAANAMDAAFDKEMGGGAAEKPKPAAAKPAGAETKAASSEAKPKPAKEPAVAQGRPAWADAPPSEPGKLYAVGSAPRGKREDAKTAAKKEIAAQLKVHVEGQTTTQTAEVTKINADGSRVGNALSSFRDEARTSVSRDLSNTSIVAEAQDAHEVWALAMLDRAAWATSLRAEIGQVDAKLSGLRDQVATASTGIRPAAKALRAVGPLAAKRDILVDDLILADPKSEVPACPIDVQALITTCVKQMATVSIRLEGAPDAVFAARTQEAMASQGLTVNEKAGSVVVRLALRESSVSKDKFTRVNVAGSATVVDPNNGNIAGSLQINESGTHLDPSNARSVMLDNASKAIAKELNERLIDLLAGGSDIGNGPAVAAPTPAPAPAPVAPAPAPAPAPVAVAPAPAPAPAAAPAVAQADADQHFVYPDEVFIDDKAFNGEGYSYVELSKVLKAPSAASKGQGQFFPLVKGKEMWTEFAWTSRVAAAADLTLGQTVIVFNDNHQNGVYLAPADKKQARTGGWFICRITDVSDLFKQQVTVAGHYTVNVANLRVVAPLK